jgi:hypothetical protein
MPTTCPQCGARLSPALTCRDQFNLGQVLELEQPAAYAVHQLSVPAYMLQHNIYSREGWLHTRALLDQFVHHGLTPQMARRQNRDKVDSGHRNFSFTKGPKLPGVESIAWTVTVADIRLDTPDHYSADVRHWAKSVLADSEPLIRSLPR